MIQHDRQSVVVLISVVIAGIIIALPLGILIASTFSASPFTFANFTINRYVEFFASPILLQDLLNQLLFAAGSMILALVLGSTTAWLISRTDIGLRSLARILALTIYFLPPFVAASAWTFLADPTNGTVNLFLRGLFGLGTSSGPINIYSFGGMIVVMGIYNSPIAFILISDALDSIDSTLEEQSIVAGAGTLRTFRRITLPLLTPAIIGSALLTFSLGAENFTIPLILGLPGHIYTLATQIFLDVEVDVPPSYGGAAISAVILLVPVITGTFLYHRVLAHERRFVTVSGKGFRRGLVKLGKWKYLAGLFELTFFLFAVILPLGFLGLASLQQFWIGGSGTLTFGNYESLFSQFGFLRTLENTIILGVAGGASLAVLGLFVGYLVTRTRTKARKLLDNITSLPLAIPGMIFSLALLLTWDVHIPLGISGTLLILLLAYITRNIPYAARSMTTSFVQASNELDEAAMVSGSNIARTFGRVTFPLVRRPFIYTLVLMYVIVLKDLGSVLFLFSGTTQVLSLTILFGWEDGELTSMAAASVVLVLLMLIGVIILERYGRRAGLGGEVFG